MALGTGLFDLSGRTALITGSSQGIGNALARGLADAGCAILLNGRNQDKLEAAAATLRADGAVVETLAFDATDHRAVLAAIDGYEERGRIDILVNNAGMQCGPTARRHSIAGRRWPVT